MRYITTTPYDFSCFLCFVSIIIIGGVVVVVVDIIRLGDRWSYCAPFVHKLFFFVFYLSLCSSFTSFINILSVASSSYSSYSWCSSLLRSRRFHFVTFSATSSSSLCVLYTYFLLSFRIHSHFFLLPFFLVRSSFSNAIRLYRLAG